jgi:hypothetical protein
LFGMMKENSDREKVMDHIDSVRSKNIYQHPATDCSEMCQQRGK